MKRATSFVYIIHAIGTLRVKIGFSDDPERRLSDLQTGSPFPLALIGSREGTVKIERAIHGYFKDRRVTGEWFEVEPDDALSALLDDNLIAGLTKPKPKPKKTGKYPRLNTMNDLYSLELSQVLLQAVDAGMLQPEETSDGWVFHVLMCPTHAMVNLPKCLMCIEEGAAALPCPAGRARWALEAST